MSSQTKGFFTKYDCDWPSTMDALQVEFWMIKQGEDSLRKQGRSLFFHYRAAQSLAWPEDDHHRWSDIILHSLCEEEITVLMGSGDSGKTNCMSRFALMDYWVYPDETLWLVSSTEYRGAELRVWGKIKELWNRGRKRYPWLSGNVLEFMHTITTEQIDEEGGDARTLTKGLILVPCKKGGSYVGLSAFVGVKSPRLRHAGDECFPKGTMVNTPNGQKPIEIIESGDLVFNARGTGVVKRISKRRSDYLALVRMKDGRTLFCTPEHPVFTNKGWERACNLNQSHYMITAHEAMQILWSPHQEQNLLQCQLRRELDNDNTGGKKTILHEESGEENKPSQSSMAPATSGSGGIIPPAIHRRQLDAQSKEPKSDQPDAQKGGSSAASYLETQHGSDKGGKTDSGYVPGCQVGLHDFHWASNQEETSGKLSDRRGTSEIQVGNRGRRAKPPDDQAPRGGREKNQPFDRAWVDRVEVFQPTHTEPDTDSEGGIEVYNFEVSGHPSYSVEDGWLVHNCQHMEAGFLDAYSNWYGKDNFKGVMAGNPLDVTDPLCTAGEPAEGGWDNFIDTGRTQSHRSKFFDANVICLDGRDSPNFDNPREDGRMTFPYLIGPKKLDAVAATHGKDSWQWFNQCIGKPNKDLALYRVLTRNLCEQHHACDDPVWLDGVVTSIYAIDPNYGGGDRCIGGKVDFGLDIDKNQILCVYPPENIPIKPGLELDPEDQIALHVQRRTNELSIAVKNTFYDSTGKGTLGSAFAKLMGKDSPVAVAFGDQPTRRPVRFDLFVLDDDGRRRLKRCDEEYSKFVTELWFSVREMVLSNQMRGLPQDVRDEFCARIFRSVAGNRIEIEPKSGSKNKPGFKERMGYSPDLADWLAIAVEGARQRGFQIRRLGPPPQAKAGPDWLEKLSDGYQKFLTKRMATA